MNAVRDSPIPHTFLACSFFLDSLPRLVSEGQMAVFGEQRNTIHFTDTDQLAEHLFHATDNPEAFGRTLTVQGREGLDFPTGAARFFQHFDPDIEVVQLPLEAIDAIGFPPEVASFLKHVSVVTGGLQEAFVSEDVHARFGVPPSTITGFAETLKREQPREA